MFTLLAQALLVLYLAKRVYLIIQTKRELGGRVPLLYTPFHPHSLIGFLLPKIPFCRILGFHWDERYSLYEDAPLNTVVIVPIFKGNKFLISRNLGAFYQSMSLNSDFHKARNEPLEIMGDNIVTTNGDTWKTHRRITAPAFNNSTYENVWNTTVRVYADMLDREGWRNVDETPVTNISKATHKLALFLIAIVGFGIPMSWEEPAQDSREKLSAQRMIFEVATYIMERSVIPKWAYSLGIEKLNEIDRAYTRFGEFMHKLLAEREAELKKIRAMEGGEANVADSLKDIFGRLVNARLSEGKHSLSDSELIGNSFVFAFAGHETTANTLSATLGLLAIHQDEQEWVYKSLIDVVGVRQPTFEDFDKLEGVMAGFIEGSRLFPAAYLLSKIASKDTSLILSQRDSPSVKEAVSLRKGANLILDMVGMCYDPNLFPDPEVYNPRRWKKSVKASAEPTARATQADEISGSSPATTLDGFLGFAYGPRTCLGHKFAKIESVAFLALLLREWRVVPVMRDGESRESWRQRVLEPRFGEALLIGEVPLKLIRRK